MPLEQVASATVEDAGKERLVEAETVRAVLISAACPEATTAVRAPP